MGAALPFIGAAISAAGAAYGINQSDQAADTMNNDTASELAQLGQLQQKATPIYQQNLTQATSPDILKQGESQALAGYQKAAQAPMQSVSSPTPDNKQFDARTQAAVQSGQQAQAKIAQYPALETAFGVGNTLTNAQLGNITAEGSSIASSLPAELQYAQAQGATGQAIGNAVGAVGGLVGAYGDYQTTQTSNQALLDKLNQLTGNFGPLPEVTLYPGSDQPGNPTPP